MNSIFYNNKLYVNHSAKRKNLSGKPKGTWLHPLRIAALPKDQSYGVSSKWIFD
jgi:hypothetical protein